MLFLAVHDAAYEKPIVSLDQTKLAKLVNEAVVEHALEVV
jgi:hypothetical protein